MINKLNKLDLNDCLDHDLEEADYCSACSGSGGHPDYGCSTCHGKGFLNDKYEQYWEDSKADYAFDRWKDDKYE